MAEVSQNTKYVKLDDGVSFSLVRTNPKLTTNTKLMYNGKKMYMESYASSELLNRTEYKNVSVRQNSTYNIDIANFLRGSGSQAYNVYHNFSNVAISDNYDNQYETLYWCGAEYIDSSFYSEEIGFVAPLYLREKIPNYFLIFRLDTPSNYNFNFDKNGKIIDSNFDFKLDILDKAVLLKTFDLREGTVLGNYIHNYVKQESFEYDKSMYVNFSNHEVTYYGINRSNGVLEKKVESFENELLKNDNPILKDDKWFTEGFERNGLIFPYIMNIEYLFDDESFKHNGGESYDFARYIGVYCNNIEFGEFDDFSELDITKDDIIYYFEDNKNNLHRYVKKSNNEIKIDGKDSELFDKSLISGFEKERITGYAEPFDINEGFINRAQYWFEILKPFEPGDWFAIDYNGHVECYFADNKNVIVGEKYKDMAIGEYTDIRFSVSNNSTINDIADALVKSVNRNKKSKFEAKCSDNFVVFYAKREGKEYNGSENGGAKMLMEASLLYSNKISLPVSNNIKYVDNNGKSLLGDYFIDYFNGSCDVDIDRNTDTYKNIFKIYNEEYISFDVNRYLKTNNGDGRRIISNMIYINVDGKIDPEYRVIIVEDSYKSKLYDVSVSSTYQVEIMDKFKPNHGVFSWFPVKDFDFDTNYSSYGQYAAFADECKLLSGKLLYKNATTEDTFYEVNKLAKSSFFDDYGKPLETEYEYYFENFLPDLCIVGKTVPYISKWGYYDEQKDSCENPYRLNVSKIFGVNNLSSNINATTCDEKEYTHSMPYYMTMTMYNKPDYYRKNYQYVQSDKKYIDYNNNSIESNESNTFFDCVEYWINEFKRTDIDKFSDIFSNKKYGKRFDKKYSRFMNGDKFNNPSTLFRGVKFEVIRQLNGVEKRSSEYNNYKFSFVYIPVMIKNITFDSTVHFVKNDTFKFIVGIVFVNTMLGIYENNIFRGGIDYFNKGFLYSACKDIIRAENTNLNEKINFELKYYEDDKNYKYNENLHFTYIDAPIIEDIFDIGKKTNIFYMWRELDIDGNSDTVFVTDTMDVENFNDIKCWFDEGKIEFENPENKNYFENVSDLNYSFVKKSFTKLNDNEFKFICERKHEEYDITIFKYKIFKLCGCISFEMNAPELTYKNITFTDVCNVDSIYDSDKKILEFSNISLKEGSLRNILFNIGKDSILSISFYNKNEGINIKFYNSNIYKNINYNPNYCAIEFDDISGEIKISNNLKKRIYNINNLKMDIEIRDKLDNNNESIGLKKYFFVFDQISMYNISEFINNNYNVKYYSTVEDNKYKINVIEPDNIEIEDKYEAFPVTIMQNNKSIVGSVHIKEKTDIDKICKKIINRYSGFYNPIFNDILYYGDEYELPYSNTSIDYTYNDNYGKFGIIKNLYYHKTNLYRSDKILSSENPVYPAINEYALGYRDYNIFNSSWDYGYFVSQDTLNSCSVCNGIGSMKDGLCMFGSKYLNLPDNIFIDTFESGEMWDGKMFMSNRDNTDTEIMYREVNGYVNVEFYLFIEKRLKRYLKDKFIDIFSKYINKTHSFGNKGTIEDDIDEYIEKNILKLYSIDKVSLYVKKERVAKNDKKIENDYLKYIDKNNEYKIKSGFPVTIVNGERVLKDSKFITKKINDLDRYIRYYLSPGFKENFGFSVSIKRK